MPALAHLTCVKADEAKLAEVLGQLQGFGVKIFWRCAAISRQICRARKSAALLMPVS